MNIGEFNFEKNGSGEVFLVARVTMNAQHSVLQDLRKSASAVTQFSGSLQFTWPNGEAHGIGVSISNGAIAAQVATVVRVRVDHAGYAEKLLATPHGKLRAWACERTYSYDNGSRIIVD